MPAHASAAVSLPDHEIPTVSPLPLMQLSIGFWSFKALATAYELDLFTHLAGTGGRTVEELAETLGGVQPSVFPPAIGYDTVT